MPPLLIPVYTEPLEAEDPAPRFYYAGLFSVTVERQESYTLFAAVDVTREGEETVLNASLDAEAGSYVPVIIDLVNEDLR
jgi:hypothetical protein